MAHAQEPSIDVISPPAIGPGGSAALRHYRPAPTHHLLEEGSAAAIGEARTAPASQLPVGAPTQDAAAEPPLELVAVSGRQLVTRHYFFAEADLLALG